MSITFSPNIEGLAIDSYTVEFDTITVEGDSVPESHAGFDSYEAAAKFAETIRDRAFYVGIRPQYAEDFAEVNMSNSNAYRVMQALGMQADYCGETEATELARVIDQYLHTAIVIDEYMMRRVGQLFKVAQDAQRLGTTVTWG